MYLKISMVLFSNFLLIACFNKREGKQSVLTQNFGIYNIIGYNTIEAENIEYKFNELRSDDLIHFIYQRPNKQKEEIFIKKKSGYKECKIITFYKDTLQMHLIDEKEFTINDEGFKVFKFLIIPQGARGISIIIISPEIGILFKKNVNSGSFAKLLSSRDQNYQQLTDIILSDCEFANNTGLPIPPPPIPPDLD